LGPLLCACGESRVNKLDSNTLLTLLLGGGFAATVAAIFKGINALRSGASARSRESIGDLARWRDQESAAREKAEGARDCAERQLYEWRAYAGSLEYELARHGMALPEGLKRPEHRG
jgi:hypothetical protein